MNCSDCQQLREEYDLLWQDYFEAMTAFMALRQSVRRAEYVHLGEACQNARARCEEARLSLQNHQAAHLQPEAAGQSC
jgi:Tfp pilus assembly protein PilN